MNRRIAILILVVNLLATAAGLWPFRPRHGHAETWNAAEIKQGLTAYLASAANSSEMEARSAEMAELMIAADTIHQESRVLLYRYLRNIVLLGGFNVVAVGTGLWMGRARVGAEAGSNQ